jgi:hypothetical protein
MNAVLSNRSLQTAVAVATVLAAVTILFATFGFTPKGMYESLAGDDAATVVTPGFPSDVTKAGSDGIARNSITSDPAGLPGGGGSYYSDEDDGGVTGVDAGGAVLLTVGFIGAGFGIARLAAAKTTGYAMSAAGLALGLIGSVMIADDQERGMDVALYFLGVGLNALVILLCSRPILKAEAEAAAWKASSNAALWGSSLIFQVLWAIAIYRIIWPNYGY